MNRLVHLIFIFSLWFLLMFFSDLLFSENFQKSVFFAIIQSCEAHAATCMVTSTDDDGSGTLRNCMVWANGNPGTTIAFNIATAPNSHDEQGNSWWRIRVLSPLPVLTADETIIDGTSQPGNTNSRGPEIEISGSFAPAGTDGFTIANAKEVTIRGLAITGFKSRWSDGGRGIVITGAQSDRNKVLGNYIGTDASGAITAGNFDGIIINGAGTGNSVGGTAVGEGNLISGNMREGIWISGTSGSIVQGNYIGANAEHMAIPNGFDGVRLQNAPATIIGGEESGARNIIPTRNYMAGCRKSPALVLNTSVDEVPVEVLGSVEVFTLLVNTKVVDLPGSDIRIRGDAINEVIEMKGGELDTPMEFRIEVSSPEAVSTWVLHIMDQQGNALRSIKGNGPPPLALTWDGHTDQEAMLMGGKLYQYQFEADYKEGNHVASPVRLFGTVRTSAVSIILGGGAFAPGSDELSGRSRQILREAAAVLRKYPKEKIIVEGHADSTGSAGQNQELARKRTDSTVSYLVNEEKVPVERIVARLAGSVTAIPASNVAGSVKSDRRIEVKGEFEGEGRPEILDHHRTDPLVKINNSFIPIDDLGRFSYRIVDRCNNIDFEMKDVQGRSVRTLMPLPTIDLPVPCQGMYTPVTGTVLKSGGGTQAQDNDGKAEVSEAEHTVSGKTDTGNMLKMNGQEVKVKPDGTFTLDLRLREGENVYAVEITNPDGYTRYVTLVIKATLEKPRQKPERKKADKKSTVIAIARGAER
jgi:parallel beta-helix repeat protein